MHDSASATLAANVRRLRSDNDWTIEALARTAGVSVRTIVNIEGGEGNPRLNIIENIARAFGTTVADLVPTVTAA